MSVKRSEHVGAAAEALGLVLRGGFVPDPAETGPAAPTRVDGRAVTAVVLLGTVGRSHFDVFASSPEARDGLADPLDRWSTRVVGALAARFGAEPAFPFGGPPYRPFLRWAQRAEPLVSSPLGMLIHPDFGLWHSWRGALLFADPVDLPPPVSVAERPSPCATCAGRPCLSACPVGAFGPAGYDTDRCAAHLWSPAGAPCMAGGCLARRACPVAADLAHGPAQAAFHMAAFRSAHPLPAE